VNLREKIREIADRYGVKVRVVTLGKGDANCRHPGCYRVRPVSGYYCCPEHAPEGVSWPANGPEASWA
jgi:hypothetical protein